MARQPGEERERACSASKAYASEAQKSVNAAAAYTRQSTSLANLPDNFNALLTRIQTADRRAARAAHAGHRQPDPAHDRGQRLHRAHQVLLELRDDSAQLAGDSTLSFEMRAASAIASAKENLSQERVVVLEALLQGSLPPEARKSYLSTQTGQAQALDAFNLVATPAQRALFDRKVAGNNLRPSTVDEGKINGLQSDTIPAGLDPSTWSTDMSERSDLMRSVEQTIDASTVQDATTLRDNVSKQIVIDVGLLFGMVLIAMLIAWSVARSMNRSLRELKQGALTVARHGLPQAVARLRDPALATQMTPAQIANADRGAVAGPEP